MDVASKHCCYTMANIIAAATAAAAVCLTYIQANVSTTPTYICKGGLDNVMPSARSLL